MDNTKVLLLDKFKRQKKRKDCLILIDDKDTNVISRLVNMGDETKPYYKIEYLENQKQNSKK